MIRRVVFWFHLVCGVTAGLFILTMAATGMTLAFSDQIVGLAEASLRHVAVPAGTPPASLDTIVASAAVGFPREKVSVVTVNSDPTSSVLVSFGKRGAVFVDPYSTRVLGRTSKARTVLNTVEDVHRRLALKDAGERITGAVALTFFFIVLSGICLWWPKMWTSTKLATITLFNPRLRGKAREWNWHNVFGFWAMPVLLMTSATGVGMSYKWANALVFRLAGSPPPASRRSEGRGDVDGNVAAQTAALDTYFKSAVGQGKTWVSITLRLPQKPGQDVTAWVLESDGFGVPVRSQATLDPVTGAVTKWEPYSSASAGKKAQLLVRYLHTGQAGGLAGQSVVFCGAGAAIMLVWTGIAMALRRLFSFRRRIHAVPVP